jgi:hypothetical protein
VIRPIASLLPNYGDSCNNPQNSSLAPSIQLRSSHHTSSNNKGVIATVTVTLGISQQTLAHYEVGRVGVGAPMLPALAEILDLSFDEILVGQVAPYRPGQGRGRRGPPSQLAQHLDAVAQLPKAKQRMLGEILTAMLAQHATG